MSILNPPKEELKELFTSALNQTLALEFGNAYNRDPSEPGTWEQLLSITAGPDQKRVGNQEQLDEILQIIFKANSYGINTRHPGIVSATPGGGLPMGAMADMITGLLNPFTAFSYSSPGCVQIEKAILRWFCDIYGYSASSFGFLTSGGSSSLTSAINIARNEAFGCDVDQRTLVIYAHANYHHCIIKVMRSAGIPLKNLRILNCLPDASLALDTSTLRAQITQDREAGLNPLCLIGYMGSTNTGSVDDFKTMADIAEDEKLWFHVDAAYGGGFILTEAGKALAQGIERADSIMLDPHKSMFLPSGTGVLLVKNFQTMKRLYSTSAEDMPYCANAFSNVEANIDLCELTPELTRPFRALRLWLPLRLYGVAAFVETLEERLRLAKVIGDWLVTQAERRLVINEDMFQLVVTSAPILSALTFRLQLVAKEDEKRSSENLKALEEKTNRNLLGKVNATNNFLLFGTVLSPAAIFVIRICILSVRTTSEKVDELIEVLDQALSSLDTTSLTVTTA